MIARSYRGVGDFQMPQLPFPDPTGMVAPFLKQIEDAVRAEVERKYKEGLVTGLSVGLGVGALALGAYAVFSKSKRATPNRRHSRR